MTSDAACDEALCAARQKKHARATRCASDKCKQHHQHTMTTRKQKCTTALNGQPLGQAQLVAAAAAARASRWMWGCDMCPDGGG